MIKIKNTFSEDKISEYEKMLEDSFKKLRLKLKKEGKKQENIPKKINNEKIVFLSYKDSMKQERKYEISAKTLFLESRENVFAVDGMQMYLDICRFQDYCTSTMKEFLDKLCNGYPNEIKYNGVEYEFNDRDKVFINGRHVYGKEKAFSFVLNKIKEHDKEYYVFYQCDTISTFKAFKNCLKQMFEDSCKLLKITVAGKKDYFINYKLMNDQMRHELLASLNIKTCPYCNRQYITNWKGNDKKNKSTADLDHFYQKVKFPLFALSLFNFVPSCQICNSRMKGTKQLETLYPYTEWMDNAHFSLSPKSAREEIVDVWLGKKSYSELQKKYMLCLEDDNDPTTENYRLTRNSINLFKLNELYENHLDEAINICMLIRIYFEGAYSKMQQSILEEIGIKSYNTETTGIFSEEELRNIMLGFVADGQGELDKPLAKLKNDIYFNEIRLINNHKNK